MEYLPRHSGVTEADPFAETESAMMISFFSRKLRTTSPEPGRPAQESQELPYDPGLVAALTHQHRAMVLLLLKAKSAAQRALYSDVQEHLAQFKQDLAGHLLREQMELHAYIQTHLKGPDRDAILRDVRASTVHVERSVDGFLKHYSNYPVGDRNVARFELEIDGVSEEFCERIEKEEASIYTLYMPAEAY